MNAENFSQYLQDRSLLHQLPYEELKTLSMQYPYCQPLQLLMLRKSLQDKREDWPAALAKVAAATSDRSLLYAEVAKNLEPAAEAEVFQLTQDYLELNSLETNAEELELAALDTDIEAPESALELDFSPGASIDSGEGNYHSETGASSADTVEGPDLAPPEEDKGEDEIEAWKAQELAALEDALRAVTPDVSGHPEVKPRAKRASLHFSEPLKEAIATAVSIAHLTAPSARGSADEELADERMAPNEPLHTPKPAPRPKSSFTSWVAQFQPPDIQTQLSDIMESKKVEDKRKLRKKEKPKSKVDAIVLQSITENDGLVSETLAKVLAKQGQQDKAEEMYRRLMLVFPEKSDYFAQQISNLKSE